MATALTQPTTVTRDRGPLHITIGAIRHAIHLLDREIILDTMAETGRETDCRFGDELDLLELDDCGGFDFE